MATLSEIIFYPVKSCAGMSVREAVLTEAGLAVDGVCDREWMLVDEDGQFLTQREYPRMALVVPRLNGGVLELSAPGLPPHAIALGRQPAAPRARCSCGTTACRPRIAATPAPPGSRRRSARHAGWCAFPPMRAALTSTRWTGGVAAPTRFADGYPVLVIGAASLADLNEKLVAAGRAALPMNRFRPNLVIDGIGAFDEDYTDTFELGAALLHRSSRARAARSRRSTRPAASPAPIRSTSCRPTGASRSSTTPSASA